MIRVRAAAIVLCVLVAGSPGLAAADDDNFANAMAAYELGDDAGALRLFEKAVRARGVSELDKLAIYTYAAVSAFRSGDRRRAEGYFKQAVALDRDVVAPYEAPQEAKDLLERIRSGGAGAVEPSGGAAEFKVDRPVEVEAGAPLPLRVKRVAGDISEVMVFYRSEPGAFSRRELTPRDGEVWSGEIPAPSVDPESGGQVEFYLEARDASGASVARFGSEGTPKITKIKGGDLAVIGIGRTLTAANGEPMDPEDFGSKPKPEEEGGSLFSEWWFWTGVGVVAVGGTVLAIVLLSGEDATGVPCDESATGTGCLDVTVTGMRPLHGGGLRW